MAFVLLLATATTFTSCSKEETYSFTVPSASILVSMPGETGYTYFDSANIASVDVVSTPKGWTVDNIDLYNSTITVTAPTTCVRAFGTVITGRWRIWTPAIPVCPPLCTIAAAPSP